MFAPLLLAVYATLSGAFSVAVLSLLVFVIYAAAMVLPLRILEATIGQKQREVWKPFSGLSFLAVLAGIPLTQAVYLAAFLSAAFARSVEWRGVVYEIAGPWKIRMRGYAPFGAGQSL